MSKNNVLTDDELRNFTTVKRYLESKEWKIGNYHTVFLSLMVTLRKSYEEVAETETDIPKMPQLATETMNLMPEVYSKHRILKTSWKRSLFDLEIALNESRIPEEYLSSKRIDGDMETVSNCVKRISKEVFGKE